MISSVAKNLTTILATITIVEASNTTMATPIFIYVLLGIIGWCIISCIMGFAIVIIQIIIIKDK